MSLQKIEEYAFEIPLMFEGDRGSGKTYDIRAYARAQSLRYLEIAGNESLEAFDFLGHVMQTESGMVWKDGKLSQAFRLASKGVKTALLIDEMLRIPQRHLSVLLSALSPDMDGNYRLQTGRMVGVEEGIGVEEEIVAPSSMIAIFATTNVGPEFAIDDLDPAVAERFIILRKDTEQAQLLSILKAKTEAKGFSPMVALKLVEFFNKTQRMVKTGQLNRHATTRTLARAIDTAKSEGRVKEILLDQILLWADRDSAGHPVREQVEALEKTIQELFAEMEREKEREKEREAKALARQRAAMARALAEISRKKAGLPTMKEESEAAAAKAKEEADAKAKKEAEEEAERRSKMKAAMMDRGEAEEIMKLMKVMMMIERSGRSGEMFGKLAPAAHGAGKSRYSIDDPEDLFQILEDDHRGDEGDDEF